MTVKIAHLGPTGTYAEAAAIAYAEKCRNVGWAVPTDYF